MTRRALLAAALSATVAACGGTPRPSTPGSGTALSLPRHIRVRSGGRVITVPLEDYVLGTVLAEIGPSNDTPATIAGLYQLQAIIVRTYAAFHRTRHASEGFDLCDATHCQVYQPERIRTSRFSADARAAVRATRGQILAYGSRPVEALFHADCGGHTAAAEAIWGGKVPYLVGTADAVPEGTHRVWTYSLSRDGIRDALNARPATAVGSYLRSLRIVSRDPSGRAETLEAVGDEVRTLRGEHLRAAINQQHGPQAVRSTRFALSVDGDVYRFDGTGWGHGVGLCQVGAIARVRRGEPVHAILSTYYPGARLVRVG